mmetsp:Transcript_7091/g.18370  ORF Transcript_7091/g.18370 Transcript_7091/m.18370 type:complete len:271 (-) Transcript_7091:183-995(-)
MSVVDAFVDPAAGVPIMVSVPADKSEPFNVVYVLDSGEEVFKLFADGAEAAHAAVAGKEGRQWHPSVLVVGIKSLPPGVGSSDFEQIIGYLRDCLIPLIQARYMTKPYAAARALCGCAGDSAALVQSVVSEEEHPLSNSFRYFISGFSGNTPPTPASLPTTPLADKTQIFLAAPAGGPHEQTARAMEGVLASRLGGKKTDTTMFVNRDGEQTYTEHERTGPAPVTLDLVEESLDAIAESVARRGMLWLGERMEAQKLASLGSLLPWHEFK